MTTWDPTEYARNSEAQWQWANELLTRLKLAGTEVVLDLGCGDGKITAAIARTVPQGRMVGIDSSEEMVRYSQDQYPVSEHPNLQFRLLDVCALDYVGEFDLIFSNAALHWVQDHRSLLRRVHRALRQGGRIAFSFGGKGNAADVLRVAFEVGRRAEWREYFQGFNNPYSFYEPEEYRPWVAEAGFRISRLELVPKDMVHRGRKGFSAWVQTTWMPITGNVPEARREDFIRELVAAYVEAFPADGEGNVHVRMTRLELEATSM